MKKGDKDKSEESMVVWSLMVFVLFIVIFLYAIIDSFLKMLGVI